MTFKDNKLSVTPVRADESVAAKALAARIDALMPRVRITELLHEAACEIRLKPATIPG